MPSARRGERMGHSYGGASFAVDGTCRILAYERTLNTSTANCWINADMFVDRMFGTLLFNPTSTSGYCRP